MSTEFKGKIEDMLLIDNPFRVVPQTNPEIWAGRKKVKKDLERFISNGLILSPTQLIIIWGDWGTGKTHAARYFTRYINYETKGLSIFMRCPRPMRGVTPYLQQFRLFIDKVGLKELVNAINFIWEKIKAEKTTFLRSIKDAEKFRAELAGRTEQQYVEDEIKKEIEILVGDPDLAKVLCTLRDEDKRLVAWKWLRGLERPADLETLGIASRINNDPSALTAFGAVLRILTFRAADGEEYRPAVFLWIDEMDTMIELFSASEQVTYLTGLRDLIDEAPNDVTIFLLFTVRDVEEALALIGEAVAARLTADPYEISAIVEIDDAEEFIVSLYNNEHYRPKEMAEKCPDKYFPFEKDAVRYIISQTESKTPRRLMVNFGKVLERALYDGVIRSTEDRITEDYAAKVLTELI